MSEESEELRAIDADHLWIGELMVDLNQLRYAELKMSRDRRYTDWSIHEIGVKMSTLYNYAKKLVAGKEVDARWVRATLRDLNRLGLHTGYVEREKE